MMYNDEAVRLLIKQMRDPILLRGGIRPAPWALADALEQLMQEVKDLRIRVNACGCQK